MSDHEWNHVAVVRDKTTNIKPRMYLNGRLLTRWRRFRMALKIERAWMWLRCKLGIERPAHVKEPPYDKGAQSTGLWQMGGELKITPATERRVLDEHADAGQVSVEVVAPDA